VASGDIDRIVVTGVPLAFGIATMQGAPSDASGIRVVNVQTPGTSSEIVILGSALARKVSPPPPPAIFYRSITVDHTKVPSTQTDFPVLVSITDATLKTVVNGGHVQRSDGFDIGFSDSAGIAPLKWEIERYNGSTGEVIAWVKIASLSSSADTVFYMRYGDSIITTDHSDPVNVWTNNFLAVYHLKDGTTLNVADSRNVNNGTNHGATATAGKIDGAGSFVSASAQYVDCGAAMNSSAAVTITAWVNAVSFPNSYNVLAGWEAVGPPYRQALISVKSNGKLGML
jgi:hypothetical protein